MTRQIFVLTHRQVNMLLRAIKIGVEDGSLNNSNQNPATNRLINGFQRQVRGEFTAEERIAIGEIGLKTLKRLNKE